MKGEIVNYYVDNQKVLIVSDTTMLINQKPCVSLKGSMKFMSKILQLVSLIISYFFMSTDFYCVSVYYAPTVHNTVGAPSGIRYRDDWSYPLSLGSTRVILGCLI